MGNSALRQLASLTEVPLSAYEGRTVAVDGHHYLYRHITGLVRYMEPDIYTTDDGTEVPNLAGLLRGLPTLLKHDITPIFVFDGEPHERKADEIAKRQAAKDQARKQMETADTEEEKRAYKAQTQSLTSTVHETTRELLTRLGIPHLEAGGSGEAYAAKLVEAGHATAALTDDYDALLFGCPLTVRQYSGKGPAERMSLPGTLSEHGITHDQLIDISILCGTDFNEGVSGIGPKRGVRYISNGKTVEEILDERDTTIENLDQLRDLFRNPDLAPVPDRQPLRDTPDFDAVRAYATDWELPQSFISENLKRFPKY